MREARATSGLLLGPVGDHTCLSVCGCCCVEAGLCWCAACSRSMTAACAGSCAGLVLFPVPYQSILLYREAVEGACVGCMRWCFGSVLSARGRAVAGCNRLAFDVSDPVDCLNKKNRLWTHHHPAQKSHTRRLTTAKPRRQQLTMPTDGSAITAAAALWSVDNRHMPCFPDNEVDE
jgi:hypothetical protein